MNLIRFSILAIIILTLFISNSLSLEEEQIQDLEKIKKLIKIIEKDLDKNETRTNANNLITNSGKTEEYIRNWINDKEKEGIILNWIQYYDDKDLDFIAKKLREVKYIEDINSMYLYLQCLKWRETHKLDELRDWTPTAEFEAAFPFKITGIDKYGNLIYYVVPSQWDVRGRIINGQKDDMLKYLLQMGESVVNMDRERLQMIVNSELPKKPLNTAYLIANLDNFSILQVTSIRVLTFFASLLRLYETHYPNLIKKVIVVNCPSYATILINIMKSILSTKTLNNLQVFGKNAEGWQESLEETFGREFVPKELGGLA